jgi:hypothetical protein
MNYKKYNKRDVYRCTSLLIIACLILGAILLVNRSSDGSVRPVNDNSTKIIGKAVNNKLKDPVKNVATATHSPTSPVAAKSIPSIVGDHNVQNGKILPCSEVFSLSTATSILGNTVSSSSSNGVTSQDDNDTVISCAYSNGSNSVSVVEHIANNTNLGASTNDVNFGSGLPSGAVGVGGYGDSAFWQQSTSQLNILKNNNWYLISYSKQGSSSLSNAEQVASALQLKD